MMAAGAAASAGKRVLLLEKNKRLGEKLRISGGGRCNILNAERDEKVLLKKYGKAEQYLYGTFAQFGMPEAYDFFTSRHLPLVVEANNRAFPHTHNAEDVVTVLEGYMRDGGVTVLTSSPVKKLFVGSDAIEGVSVGDVVYVASSYIVATGGVSHKETGSTGDGFAFLKAAGVAVKDPTPALVPLEVKEAWVKALSGTTLQNVKLTISVDGVKKLALKGNILCTHFGISGPLILNHSQKIAELLHEGDVTAMVDLFPATDHGALEKEILAFFDEHKNKDLKNVLKDMFPEGLSKGVGLYLESLLPLTTKVHSVTKEDRKKIMHACKALPITILGLMGFDKAVVADGGISLDELDMKTMRVKKFSNLYVTGDMLHINRPSGGYSLQLCWTTGYVAGKSAAETT
jgi:predicted Rossmann fold flavoprotein